MPYWYQMCRSPIVIVHAMIGVFLFGYSYHRRTDFLKRFLLSMAAALVLSYLSQHAIYQTGVTVAAVATQSLVAIINYFLVLLVCSFCLEESIWTVIYVTNAGMTAQGIGGCVKTIVKLIPVMDRLANHNAGILLVDLICYGSMFLLVYFTFRSLTQERETAVGTKRKAIFAASVLLFYMGTTWLSRDYTQGGSRTYVIIINIYSILVQIMIYTVQFGILERDKMSNDIELMRELIHEQHSQYETSKESVELINEKYHDLRNLIGSIQNVLPQEEVDRLKTSINRYDVQVRTGYEVLDVVLTEKMNLCLQRNITMTCNIGKTDFSFLGELDLYTLINNALTNAINAVSVLPENRARYIVFTASQENNMITIHVENPCFEHLEFVDGLPQTKQDTDWHGFGMKSMQRTAEKYGGVLSASHHKGNFQLDILLLNLQEGMG